VIFVTIIIIIIYVFSRLTNETRWLSVCDCSVCRKVGSGRQLGCGDLCVDVRLGSVVPDVSLYAVVHETPSHSLCLVSAYVQNIHCL